MERIDTVVFDLDGTLLDTLEDLKNSVVYVQEKYGCPIHTKDQVRSHVGNGIPNLIAKSVPGEKEHPFFETILKDYKEHYNLHCNDNTLPYPGILSMMDELKQKGYKMAIVSNKSDPAVKALNQIHFADYIEVAIGGNEEAGIRRKPAPDTVFTALRELGSKAEQAVYIGDSEVDILTAENSGMPCILCEWGFRDKDYLLSEGGTYFVKEAGELPSMIRRISEEG